MKDDQGRTFVSRTAVWVVGVVWAVGSLLLGWTTAPWGDLATRLEFTLVWAALGFLPAVVAILVWSHLE
jgi:hypothetical protein